MTQRLNFSRCEAAGLRCTIQLYVSDGSSRSEWQHVVVLTSWGAARSWALPRSPRACPGT